MTTTRCIVCWLNFLNKKNHSGDDPYLMNLCPECKKTNVDSKYTVVEALADERNIVHGITCTLRPKYHICGVAQVCNVYKKIIETYIRNRRTPNYVEAYFEYTDNGVLHMHAYVVGRKNIISPMYGCFRRLGHVLIKQIFDSEQWIDYIKKEQSEDSPSPIIICT